jgi:hypothetical protein
MKKQTLQVSGFIILWLIAAGCANTIAQELTPNVNADIHDVNNAQSKKTDVRDVNTVLEKLHKSTLALTSYETQIEFKFTQPVLFDSQTLKKGFLYYTKKNDKPNFRVNFNTLKQDEQDEKKYIEQWIVLDGSVISTKDRQLKGTWLVFIDYATKELKYYQLTEPAQSNEPIDVFELISRNLPIVGFSRPEDLKKQFEVSIAEPNKEDSADFIKIHLDTRPGSDYKDDYQYIDFWIDKAIFLPVKIVAITTEDDIYEIKFLKPQKNAVIKTDVFDFTVPKGFAEPEIFLHNENTNNDL